MKFGMYCEVQCPTGGDHVKVINDLVALVEQCDELGYDYFSTIEHPFFENFSLEVNPLALYCKLAERTRQIRFRTLCHTLPLHNPMILAGEIALADILTGGRIECGVGRGHAWLPDKANVRMEEMQQRFSESLDILVKAWTEDSFSYEGEFYKCDALSVVPKPLQKPHPPILQVGTSKTQLPRAAANGWAICLGGPVPAQPFLEPLAYYRECCAKEGTEPRMGWLKAIYLDEDESTALAQAREPVLDFIRYNFSPIHTIPRNTEQQRQRLIDAGYGFYADPPFLPILDWSFEDLVGVYVGTPDKVLAQLLELWQLVEYDELHIISHYGHMTPADAHKTQRLFAERIMPVLREHAQTSTAA